MESFGNVRVHLDVELLLGRQVFIAAFDLQLDPASKRLTQHCEGHVDEPLARHLVHVTVLRQVVVDERVLPGCGEQPLDGEVLVERTVQVLDVLTFDTRQRFVKIEEPYNLRLPVTRSLRKYTVRLSQLHR